MRTTALIKPISNREQTMKVRILTGLANDVELSVFKWASGHGLSVGGYVPKGLCDDDLMSRYTFEEIDSIEREDIVWANIKRADCILLVSDGCICDDLIEVSIMARNAEKPIVVVDIFESLDCIAFMPGTVYVTGCLDIVDRQELWKILKKSLISTDVNLPAMYEVRGVKSIASVGGKIMTEYRRMIDESCKFEYYSYQVDKSNAAWCQDEFDVGWGYYVEKTELDEHIVRQSKSGETQLLAKGKFQAIKPSSVVRRVELQEALLRLVDITVKDRMNVRDYYYTDLCDMDKDSQVDGCLMNKQMTQMGENNREENSGYVYYLRGKPQTGRLGVLCRLPRNAVSADQFSIFTTPLIVEEYGCPATHGWESCKAFPDGIWIPDEYTVKLMKRISIYDLFNKIVMDNETVPHKLYFSCGNEQIQPHWEVRTNGILERNCKVYGFSDLLYYAETMSSIDLNRWMIRVWVQDADNLTYQFHKWERGGKVLKLVGYNCIPKTAVRLAVEDAFFVVARNRDYFDSDKDEISEFLYESKHYDYYFDKILGVIWKRIQDGTVAKMGETDVGFSICNECITDRALRLSVAEYDVLECFCGENQEELVDGEHFRWLKSDPTMLLKCLQRDSGVFSFYSLCLPDDHIRTMGALYPFKATKEILMIKILNHDKWLFGENIHPLINQESLSVFTTWIRCGTSKEYKEKKISLAEAKDLIKTIESHAYDLNDYIRDVLDEWRGNGRNVYYVDDVPVFDVDSQEEAEMVYWNTH